MIIRKSPEEIDRMRRAGRLVGRTLSAVTAAARPGVQATTALDRVLDRSDVQVVVVATPAPTHFELARRALLAGKHVLVEKPLATSLSAAQDLTILAAARGQTLMVGHVYVYHPVVRRLAELMAGGDLGEIVCVASERTNPTGTPADGSVLWNLAPHDLSIIVHLLGADARWVSARSPGLARAGPEEVVFLAIELASGALVEVQVSWIAPTKARRMTFIGSAAIAVFDELAAELDHSIRPRVGEEDFVTAVLAQFSRHGELQLVNCGHPPPLRFRAGAAERLASACTAAQVISLPRPLVNVKPAPTSGPRISQTSDVVPADHSLYDHVLDAAFDAQAELNPQQAAAATHGEGPLLIIAGAGTGKTRTLVYRVAPLIERGVSAERILLLTFTRRAAASMLTRAAALADVLLGGQEHPAADVAGPHLALLEDLEHGALDAVGPPEVVAERILAALADRVGAGILARPARCANEDSSSSARGGDRT